MVHSWVVMDLTQEAVEKRTNERVTSVWFRRCARGLKVIERANMVINRVTWHIRVIKFYPRSQCLQYAERLNPKKSSINRTLVAELIMKGRPVREIARRAGCSDMSVYVIRKELEVAGTIDKVDRRFSKH